MVLSRPLRNNTERKLDHRLGGQLGPLSADQDSARRPPGTSSGSVAAATLVPFFALILSGSPSTSTNTERFRTSSGQGRAETELDTWLLRRERGRPLFPAGGLQIPVFLHTLQVPVQRGRFSLERPQASNCFAGDTRCRDSRKTPRLAPTNPAQLQDQLRRIERTHLPAGAVSKVTSAWARGTRLLLMECAASHAGRGRVEKEFSPCTEAAKQLQVVCGGAAVTDPVDAASLLPGCRGPGPSPHARTGQAVPLEMQTLGPSLHLQGPPHVNKTSDSLASQMQFEKHRPREVRKQSNPAPGHQ
ncbi:uncharacterized protein LOC128627157 [Artibeus jamaicensis]|uniref:uncharacterized protein LOC128627157 n=1 Tax=Artibeus jamaicensis TaxID=9417 RepID=UPI00235AACC8|nr:uncharacterized protein LOC128627157 [Artibeus jamaicensis]